MQSTSAVAVITLIIVTLGHHPFLFLTEFDAIFAKCNSNRNKVTLVFNLPLKPFNFSYLR